MPSQTRTPLAVAALSFELNLNHGQAPQEFRLFPAGRFRAADGSGRPAQPAAGWLMNAAAAQRLIAATQARQNDYLLDYEHATLTAAKAGQKAPAAGWFKKLEWREGDGLYVINPRFTATAAQHIAALEYRYVSPVFAWDPQSGEVLAFYHAALTNDPGLDGLTDFSALTAHPDFSPPLPKEPQMKLLLAALGLAETATEAEGLVALSALKTRHETSVAALSAQKPDPAAYIDVASFSAVQAELATLKATQRAAEVAALMAEGQADGRILPQIEDWARELGEKDIASLKAFLAKAPKVAALQGTQSGGQSAAGAGGNAAALSAEQNQVAQAMGLSVAQYKKALEV